MKSKKILSILLVLSLITIGAGLQATAMTGLTGIYGVNDDYETDGKVKGFIVKNKVILLSKSLDGSTASTLEGLFFGNNIIGRITISGHTNTYKFSGTYQTYGNIILAHIDCMGRSAWIAVVKL